jgi:putative oxidoreductase
MRRLFSSFARGWPGVGLLLMRLVAAIALGEQTVARIWHGSSPTAVVLDILMLLAATLLLAGLWTPIAGLFAVGGEIWGCFSYPADVRACLLLAALIAALILIGPGAWSVDARLFGWKRIDIRDRKS